jgi:hypothetical protein
MELFFGYTPLIPARARYPISTKNCGVLVLMMTNDLSQQKNAPDCCNCHCTTGHKGSGQCARSHSLFLSGRECTIGSAVRANKHGHIFTSACVTF